MLRNHPIMQQFNQITNGKRTFEEKKEAIFEYGEKIGYSREEMENFLNSQNFG